MYKQSVSYFLSVSHLVLCKVPQIALEIIFKAIAESIVISSSYIIFWWTLWNGWKLSMSHGSANDFSLRGAALAWKTEIDGRTNSKFCILKFKKFLGSEPELGQYTL